MAEFERIVRTKDEVKQAALNCARVGCALVEAGKRVRLACVEDDDRTLQQNRFYWGPVLGDISGQATIGGQRWTKDAYHELFKRQILGYKVRAVKVAGRKKPTYIRSLRSTTELTVGQMSKYLDEVIAFATTDLGVKFTETRWQDYMA